MTLTSLDVHRDAKHQQFPGSSPLIKSRRKIKSPGLKWIQYKCLRMDQLVLNVRVSFFFCPRWNRGLWLLRERNPFGTKDGLLDSFSSLGTDLTQKSQRNDEVHWPNNEGRVRNKLELTSWPLQQSLVRLTFPEPISELYCKARLRQQQARAGPCCHNLLRSFVPLALLI